MEQPDYLDRALIEKLARDCGFDLPALTDLDGLKLRSSRFRQSLWVRGVEREAGQLSALLVRAPTDLVVELLDAGTEPESEYSDIMLKSLSELVPLLLAIWSDSDVEALQSVADLDAATDGGLAYDSPETERLAETKRRLQQERYRDALFDKWGHACAVTGIRFPPLLRASHAKPWRLASALERLDPDNGLPLVADLDALFDRGLIAFDEQGKVLIDDRVPHEVRLRYGINSGVTSLSEQLNERQLGYLAWHRKELFGSRSE